MCISDWLRRRAAAAAWILGFGLLMALPSPARAADENAPPAPASAPAANADGAGEDEENENENAPKPPPPTPEELSAAVRTLRELAATSGAGERDPKRLEAGREAWRLVVSGREGGAVAVKDATTDLEAVGGGDDLFRLIAGGLLWQTGGLEEIDALVELWSDPALDLSRRGRLVFSTVFQAARTGDESVLPLIALYLREPSARLRLRNLEHEYEWPDTVEFVWAAYGPQGRAPLLDILAATVENDGDPDFAASAAWLLARDAYAPVLPLLRGLAGDERKENASARLAAIRGLGIFGHPDDYEPLTSLLDRARRENDLPLAEAALDALGEFGRMDAAALFVDMLKDEKSPARERAAALLVNLLTPVGFDALRGDCAKDHAVAQHAQGDDENDPIANVLAFLEKSSEEYDRLSDAEKSSALARWRAAVEADYVGDSSAPDGTPFTRAQFDEAMDVLMQTGEFPVAGMEWVRPRHLLSVATPEDAELFLTARKAAARPLSPSALANMDVFSAMATRLTRAALKNPTAPED